MTKIQELETKLENGVQVFSAQDIAYLLNMIRVYNALADKKKTK